MKSDAATRLRGKAAVANSRLAYEVYERMLSSARWQALAAKGAKPQRLLWASTGVKDKAYSDTKYVIDLVARDTVNTMPEATLQAVADHGEVHGDTVRDGYAAAHTLMEDLRKVGVDVAEVANLLERQGVESFEKSWEELIASVTEQVKKAGATVLESGAVKPAHGGPAAAA
jgi:transaldolase